MDIRAYMLDIDISLKRLLFCLVLSPVLVICASCTDFSDEIDRVADGIGTQPNAIVTVRKSASGKTYFQLDEKTTLEPLGWKNPFKSQTRALVSYSETSEESKEFTKAVRVNQIDSVLTKDAIVMKTSEFEVNNDPVEIVTDWLTVCEDGYLTLHFATMWGADRIPHKVILGVDPEKPYELYFKHDKNGDYGTSWSEGLVAFKIDGLLPDTKGEEVNITLKWKSFSGDGKMAFKYRTRED